MLHFVVGTIMYSYNTVEQALIIVQGANLIVLVRCLLTILSTQEAAVIALKMCKSICSDIKCCKSHSS